MTCVAGLVAPDGSVILMADSAASSPGNVWVRKDRKVWMSGELALGFCGSFRGRDLLMYRPIPQPKPEDNIEAYMRTIFVTEVREAFKAGGFMTQFREGDDSTKTRLLIGARGRLFWMESDFQLAEVEIDFNAIGSGAPEALGSLFSTQGWDDPMKRLQTALNASVYFNPGVRPPFYYVRTASMHLTIQEAA